MKLNTVAIVLICTLSGAVAGIWLSRHSQSRSVESAQQIVSPIDDGSTAVPRVDQATWNVELTGSGYQAKSVKTQEGVNWFDKKSGQMVSLHELSDESMLFIANNQIGRNNLEIFPLFNSEFRRRGLHTIVPPSGDVVDQSYEIRADEIERLNKLASEHKFDAAMDLVDVLMKKVSRKAKIQSERAEKRIAESKRDLILFRCRVEIGRWMRTQRFGESGHRHWSPNATEVVKFRNRPDSWKVAKIHVEDRTDLVIAHVIIFWQSDGRGSNWTITFDSCDTNDPKILDVRAL